MQGSMPMAWISPSMDWTNSQELSEIFLSVLEKKVFTAENFDITLRVIRSKRYNLLFEVVFSSYPSNKTIHFLSP